MTRKTENLYEAVIAREQVQRELDDLRAGRKQLPELMTEEDQAALAARMQPALDDLIHSLRADTMKGGGSSD